MAAPRRPRAVRVGPFDYTIRYTATLEPHRDHDLAGLCEPEAQTIDIRPDGQHPQHRAETLLHEIVHAALDAAGLGETLEQHPANDVLPGGFEEMLVRALAPVLLGVIRDNPAVVAYLTARHA